MTTVRELAEELAVSIHLVQTHVIELGNSHPDVVYHATGDLTDFAIQYIRKAITNPDAPVIYLSAGQLAQRLGVDTATIRQWKARYSNTPRAHALTGNTYGWLPESIPAWRRWMNERPGQGAGGGRPRKPFRIEIAGWLKHSNGETVTCPVCETIAGLTFSGRPGSSEPVIVTCPNCNAEWPESGSTQDEVFHNVIDKAEAWINYDAINDNQKGDTVPSNLPTQPLVIRQDTVRKEAKDIYEAAEILGHTDEETDAAIDALKRRYVLDFDRNDNAIEQDANGQWINQTGTRVPESRLYPYQVIAARNAGQK